MFFTPFLNICFFPEVHNFSTNAYHTASARRIDPRYPELPISTFKILFFFRNLAPPRKVVIFLKTRKPQTVVRSRHIAEIWGAGPS